MGNDGPADDILLDGCRLDAYHSTEQGSPQPPEHTQIAAVMMTPNQQDKVCLTLRRSWLTGGVFTFNASAPANANSIIVLADNEWERPRNGGPSAAIALDPTLVNRTLSNNVYSDDGSPVPVYSA